MILPVQIWSLVLLALSSITHARPASSWTSTSTSPSTSTHEKRDADIASLAGLTRLTRDRSGKRGDPVDKYFHESTFHPHYDGRFAERVIKSTDRRTHLTALVRTYLSTMRDIGAETWIMHGSLLGWWWNRHIMPWDSDIDVQISEDSIKFLADYYNMTVHHYRIPDTNQGRNYLLEINPHYNNASTADKLNRIDARWIDTETGLFIDITALRRDREAEERGEFGKMMCKDKHHYLEKDIFPLRDSVFEDVPVKIPFAYTELLEEEYGAKALTKTKFEGHTFVKERMEWVPTYQLRVKPSEKLSWMRPGGITTKTGPGGNEKRRSRHWSLRPGQVGEVHHAPGSSLDIVDKIAARL